MKVIVHSDGTYFEWNPATVRVITFTNDEDVETFENASDSTRWRWALSYGQEVKIRKASNV